jgi:hypothetical protein
MELKQRNEILDLNLCLVSVKLFGVGLPVLHEPGRRRLARGSPDVHFRPGHGPVRLADATVLVSPRRSGGFRAIRTGRRVDRTFPIGRNAAGQVS